MSDSTRAILEAAHTQLVDREAMLQAFGRELAQTTQARKDLERTLAKFGGSPTRPKSRAVTVNVTVDGKAASSPRAAFTDRVIHAMRGNGPLTRSQIAAKLGRDEDGYLASILSSAAMKGQLAYDEDDHTYRVAR